MYKIERLCCPHCNEDFNKTIEDVLDDLYFDSNEDIFLQCSNCNKPFIIHTSNQCKWCDSYDTDECDTCDGYKFEDYDKNYEIEPIMKFMWDKYKKYNFELMKRKEENV